MILTPQERGALLTLVALLLFGQALSLWHEHRRSRPDRELSSWLSRLEAVRADTVLSASDSAEAPPGDSLEPLPSRFGEATAPIQPADSIPPGLSESGRLRINLASARDLETLPGIGPETARRIVEERARGGPFLRPQDLLRVRGIGPKKLRRIQDRVDCSPP